MLPNLPKPPTSGPPQECCMQDFKYETVMLDRDYTVWSRCWICGRRWEWDRMARVWKQKAKAKTDG